MTGSFVRQKEKYQFSPSTAPFSGATSDTSMPRIFPQSTEREKSARLLFSPSPWRNQSHCSLSPKFLFGFFFFLRLSSGPHCLRNRTAWGGRDRAPALCGAIHANEPAHSASVKEPPRGPRPFLPPRRRAWEHPRGCQALTHRGATACRAR